MSKSELHLVEWFRAKLASEPARVPIGIGDDMAAVRLDGSLVAITSDMLLDGVHFDTQQHAYPLIGRKAVACSLSDCAAMGCEPRGATISLALSDAMSVQDVQWLYEGMSQVAGDFNCPIVGGDTTSWNGKLAIDVAMMAEPMSPRGPIRRTTAQAGDIIYVSGSLGGSILGRHLTFTPRLELARRLVAEPDLHAMMDLSDGLSLDLHRLCVASNMRAELSQLELESAVSHDARTLAARDGRKELDHALSDGEDYELLICGGEGLSRIVSGLIRVGRLESASPGAAGQLEVVAADGSRRQLEPKGYEHFR